MTALTNEDLLEIYAAASSMEAERLVLLLGEDGIEAMARATTMSSFPTPGQYLILVKGSDREKALKTITDARREGAISDRGELL
ncbi:MAG: hypothetical protein Q8O67_23515 [Deltaproteobacteria bacterium]|nr:hypothetical protein [Deltaproteobacteria bacterium]